jgi:hypothetical protein
MAYSNGYTNGHANGHAKDHLRLAAPGEPRPRRRWWLSALALALALGFGYWVYHRRERSSALQPFEERLPDFAAARESASPAAGEPYLRGKLLVMKRDAPEIDGLFFELPEELRAAGPAEVGSVAFVACGEIEVGRYEGGSAAIQSYCEAALLDLEARALVGERRVLGPPPPYHTSSAHGKVYGGAADKGRLVEWLAKLPRR